MGRCSLAGSEVTVHKPLLLSQQSPPRQLLGAGPQAVLASGFPSQGRQASFPALHNTTFLRPGCQLHFPHHPQEHTAGSGRDPPGQEILGAFHRLDLPEPRARCMARGPSQ